MSNNKKMLSDQNQAFNIQKLRELLNSAQTLNETITAKQYITSYFAHCLTPKGVLMWDPTIHGFHHFREKEAQHILNEKKLFKKSETEDTQNKQEYNVFNIWSWFYFDYKIFYKIDVNPTKPRVYEDEKGQKYINKFPGYLYPNSQPYNTFSNEIQACVKIILDHIQKVLCSDKPDQTQYMFGWLSNMISGRKMNTAIFLHSGQGTGKTIITNFIQNKVIGSHITHKTANEKVITGDFNKELEGKVLLILEEMSGSKTGDWISFANRLKDFIDGKVLIIEEKGKTPYPVTNIISLLINSNNSKAVRLDRDDRRYFIPDISDQYVGNTEYFDMLGKAMNTPKVGEAFYSFMRNYAMTYSFDERKLPIADAKRMMISEAVHNVHLYIKQEYLIKNMNLDKLSSNLHNHYKTWVKDNFNSKKPSSIQEFSQKMKEIGLVAKQIRKNGSRNMQYQAFRDDIYNTYKKKGWIDDLENIDEPINKIAETLPVEKPSVVPIAVNITTEKISLPEPLKFEIKKIPPKVPPKPEHLKCKVTSNIKIDDLKESLPLEECVNTSVLEERSILNASEINENIEHANSSIFEKFYKEAKENWINHDNDSDDFDWECFILELKDLSVKLHCIQKYSYHHYLRDITDHYRIIMSKKDTKVLLETEYPTYIDIIKMLNDYLDIRDTEFISPPDGYVTVSNNTNVSIQLDSELNDDEAWDENFVEFLM